MSKIKTGIFGGSFNPIHIGHLALANYICEYGGIDELWFMVSPQNPLKQDESLLEDSRRLELVRLATQDYAKFKVSDFEFHLPRPSYTIQLLEALKGTYPEREFTLIIGADNWQLFDRWKESERLLAENKIMVYPRRGIEVREEDLPANVSLVQAPLFEISSTFIRKALQEGNDVRYFLHPEVYRKIKELHLY